jgi:hypothetical protein
VIDERGGLGALRTLLDLRPEVEQKAEVGAEIFFRSALGGGAHDESAGGFAALTDENPLEALALLIGGDFAADADVRDGGHEDQEAAGQGDVRGDAGALFGDGLLGDLNQNLLAWLQEVGDDGQVGGLRGAARGTATARVLAGRALRAAAGTATATATIAALLSLAFAGCGLAFGGGFFGVVLFILIVAVVFAVLAVEVQLDAVVKVGFLEQFAQVAGAHLDGEGFFLIVFEVVLVGLGVMVMRRVELLFFDDLFFNVSAAGSVGRGGRLGSRRRGCGFFGLLLAQPKEAEGSWRERVNVVGGVGVRFRRRFRGRVLG